MTVSGTGGRVYAIATPIGNLEDLSPRGLRHLRESAVIACEDTRRTARLCARLGVDTPRLSLHAHNERRRTPELMARLAAGDDVALVSDAGTPLLSDPGARFLEAVRAGGFGIVPVPGASAVLAALVASGLPVQPFSFFGFLPRRGRARQLSLARIRLAPGTVVLFEAPPRVNATLRDLADALGPRRVSIARELTKLHEEVLYGRLGEIELLEERGEVTLVIARADGSDDEPMADADVDGLIRRLLVEGHAAPAIAREVAEVSGRSRGLIYRRLLALDVEEDPAD